MITTPQEYFAKLYLIQDVNKPSIAVLAPSDENTYEIDLSTRTIQAPASLSIEKDHMAETIYFKCDQFYDYVDLSQTTCIIQYINAKQEAHIYAVPFFDVTTEEGKMIFPWCIDGAVTAAAGSVSFSIKFYHTFKGEDNSILFDFNLNTLTARSKVLTGLDVDKNQEPYQGLASQIESALANLDEVNKEDIKWLYV